MAKVPITRSGYRNLLGELSHLRRVVRPQVLEELQEARLLGCKLDNAQYRMAREKHLILQRKIEDLEEKLECCEVVVGRKYYFRQVGFGTVAVIQNVDSGEQHRYQLVGPYESDVESGKLSIHSPVGRGLMGRCEGEEVAVLAPAGVRIYRIVAVHL
jgi:transcription elongation factor GreA